jgi:FtsP/CotA-like multicopper oxidase with cupredoxin domain
VRTHLLAALAILLALTAALLTPPKWWPEGLRQDYYALLGEPVYRPPPPTREIDLGDAETPCEDRDRAWRAAQTVDGVPIAESLLCNPDNPAAVAAFVKGTNNVSPMTLMDTLLAPDAVVKGNDRDGDGDPDEIHIRLEVAELNGASPEIAESVPGYAIAPGIKPGFWVFAPKTRGMATASLIDLAANRMLRAPSPVIRVEAGDTVRVTLENGHYMPHTIHFHGVDHPYVDAEGEGNDGVPQTSEKPVMPGMSRTYEMTPRQTGTMFYHCHVQPSIHILMGLQGMFVIEENRPDNPVQTLNIGAGQVRHRSVHSRAAFDREYDLHYQDLDKELHALPGAANDPRLIIEQAHRRYDVTERSADYFILNGRSFPYTFRESVVVVAPDETVKLRVLNGGAEEVALHSHGHKIRISHYDGIEHAPAAQITRDVVQIAPAQRVDLVLETTNDGLHSYGEGLWLLHDHHEPAVTNDGLAPGGGITAIAYQSYLDEKGWPRPQGVDWTPYFTADYYRRALPVWSPYDPLGLLGEAGAGPAVSLRALLLALVIGLLAGTLILLLRPRRPGPDKGQ